MITLAYIAAFSIYILLLILVGCACRRQQTTATTFMTGSHSVNYWITAVATHATDMSTWLFMAFPGAIFCKGLTGCWDAVGLTLGIFLTWQCIAPRLRRMTAETKSSTLSSFFEKQFNDASGSIRLISACMATIFFTFYISAGITGLGRALESTFSIPYHIGIVLGTGAVTLYTLMGGFLAVAWTNFLQGIFVLVVIMLVPLYAGWLVGGTPVIIEAMKLKGVALSLFDAPSSTLVGTLILPSLAWGLGYFGQPHILINFMGLDDVKNIRRAQIVGMMWHVLSLSAAAAIALIGIALFQHTQVESELVFVTMVQQLFPSFIAGWMLCAIFAAAISTMNSQILVAASTIAEDIYKTFFNPKLSSEHLITIVRIAGVIITCIACLFAWGNHQSILDLVYYAWSGLGASFGPVVIASLYLPSISRYGACASMLTGGLVVGIWPYLGINFNAPLLIAFIASFAMMYLVSRLYKVS